MNTPINPDLKIFIANGCPSCKTPININKPHYTERDSKNNLNFHQVSCDNEKCSVRISSINSGACLDTIGLGFLDFYIQLDFYKNTSNIFYVDSNNKIKSINITIPYILNMPLNKEKIINIVKLHGTFQ